jgi:hypothetical protein
MKKRNGLEVSAIIVRCAMTALIAFLLLGAKNCEVNDKADILKLHPEFKGVIDKFDIKKSGNLIRLTTYDNLSFREAIERLKKTPMNIPIAIAYYDNDESIGEFDIEIAWKNLKNYDVVFRFYDGKQPYKGIIWLFDGWWDALEVDAYSCFVNEKPDAEGSVFIKELNYGNKRVIELNNFDTNKKNHTPVRSRLAPGGGTSTIKGDGSTPYTMFEEFDE